MDEKRKPLWPKIVVTVVVLVVLYVASFGPACWLAGHGHVTETTVYRLYAPLISAASMCGRPARNALEWYGGLWSEDGYRLVKYESFMSG